MIAQGKYIVIDKDICDGTPVFAETRVAVQTLLDYIEELSLDDFLHGFPSVSRIAALAVLDSLNINHS